MGRPPCCEKVLAIKKGPWTPEEDIILVSYIQQHGPGNWRSVPTNTGLLRCSKSCRLRWTNYLRPGIKRGNFTPHEEGMIIHLQAILGNKWAAIASYLPQRTDNDIKNYWNTHLKKKIKRFQPADSDPQISSSSSSCAAVNQNQPYASSAENISRLLEGWMRSSPNMVDSKCYTPVMQQEDQIGGGEVEMESILSFDHNLHSFPCTDQTQNNIIAPGDHEEKPKLGDNPPLSFLENWLWDETAAAQAMEIPSIF